MVVAGGLVVKALGAAMGALNTTLALRLSGAFGTMGCFWAFCLLALLPLAWPPAMPYVQFISSAFLQLVALPLLAVAAKIIQAQQEVHKASLEELHRKHDEAHSAGGPQ